MVWRSLRTGIPGTDGRWSDPARSRGWNGFGAGNGPRLTLQCTAQSSHARRLRLIAPTERYPLFRQRWVSRTVSRTDPPFEVPSEKATTSTARGWMDMYLLRVQMPPLTPYHTQRRIHENIRFSEAYFSGVYLSSRNVSSRRYETTHAPPVTKSWDLSVMFREKSCGLPGPRTECNKARSPVLFGFPSLPVSLPILVPLLPAARSVASHVLPPTTRHSDPVKSEQMMCTDRGEVRPLCFSCASGPMPPIHMPFRRRRSCLRPIPNRVHLAVVL